MKKYSLRLAVAMLTMTGCLGWQGACRPLWGQVSGIDIQNISKEISPSDDFFRYVNDVWLKNTPIPDDQSDYGSFTALDIETKDAIRQLIESASQTPNPSSIARQVGDFYKSYTDIATRNKLGINPALPVIKTVESIKTKSDYMRVAGELGRKGVSSLFGVYVDSDAKRSDQYAIYVGQGGTTLPDRDYYLDAKFEAPLAAYRKYVESMLKELQWPAPAEFANKIVDLEIEMAKIQWTKVQLRDPVKQYNKMTTADFAKSIPSLDWNAYAIATGLKLDAELVIGQPSFFESMSKVFEKTDLDVLKAALAFQAINTYAPILSESLEAKHFAFFETTLSGVEEQEPLERRAVNACNGLLGMPVGQLYVEKYYTQRAEEKMDQLIKNLLKAFEIRINQLEWMGQGTKKEALQKLSTFNPKIGKPKKWKDYSSVSMDPKNVVANVSQIAEFEHNYALQKLGNPVNREEWYMGPQTVNAYYNPTMNEIVFPAAILQPPFFNLEADDAVNYGGIGAVIGHEISHGFDDSGARFDGKGNLRNWWTPNDEAEFQSRSKLLVDQYSGYEPLPGMKVNGEFTLGENIGDLGGLAVAFTAYKLSLGDKPSPVIDGMTGEQRFFAGWAQVWRRKYREPELKKRLANDPHSPSQYRCNGIVSNMDAFYEAFQVKPGSGMYIAPEKRVRIW
jgi:endothelin-converting enzyme/putative endopeptidase